MNLLILNQIVDYKLHFQKVEKFVYKNKNDGIGFI